VPYADYGIHDAQGDFNRPVFVNLFATEWAPLVPGLVERLASDPPARVAEIGCGEGWAAVSIAKAWPMVSIDGYDLDEASIAAARKHAAEAGVADRVRFEVADVTGDVETRDAGDGYDFVFAFEMIHDLAQPSRALETMRHLGASDAIFLVVDENAAETFEAPTENPIERLFYAASVLHCLPVGMSDAPSAGTGTVMRPDTFRGYASDAGFTGVEVLPIEHDMFRFYALQTA
jgi:2-polyprenyl-3-methyl-5-hydroxy-6-metoxy-1,4-benzoquinol methylase